MPTRARLGEPQPIELHASLKKCSTLTNPTILPLCSPFYIKHISQCCGVYLLDKERVSVCTSRRQIKRDTFVFYTCPRAFRSPSRLKKVIAIIQLFSTRLKRWKLPYTQHNASSFSFLPAEPSQKLLQSIQSISKLSLPPQTGAILF